LQKTSEVGIANLPETTAKATEAASDFVCSRLSFGSMPQGYVRETLCWRLQKNAVQPPFMQPKWILCRHFSKKLSVFLDAFSTISHQINGRPLR